jgi:signal transduction histidine kinase
MWLLVGLSFVVVVIGTLAAKILFDYTRKEFSTLNDFAVKVEVGDFVNIPLTVNDKNEFGNLKRTLNTMVNGLARSRDQLVQSEKMASLGSLVAGVSHEINTPVGIGLTGVTHLQELIKDLKRKYESSEMSEEDFNGFLDHASELGHSIELNLNRAASHVRSFKQVAVDQTSEERREFWLREYIDEVLISLRNRTKKTNIKFAVDIDENLRLNSYPGAFSQIITNFVMNSLTHAFTPDCNGNISIIAKKDGSRLLLCYKDDGKGIEMDVVKKIFDPFFTTNREQGGSGLGLNIVHNLVTQRLKGKIICNSTLGKGTEFVLTVPLNEG